MSIVLTLIIVLLLVLFSAVCSGLNIALMALDTNDLRRKAKLGNRMAIRVLPLRLKTHLTLASILLTNVSAVSATSLVLGEQFSGLTAGIISTFLIVVFGEVLPQAIFAKNPLAWTGRLTFLLKAMNIIVYPAAKPIQILLDKIVGHKPRHLHGRHELGMLITEHLDSEASELDEDEVEIVLGALQLSEKKAQTIMTPIADVYWLTPSTALSENRLDEITSNSYSRIPIFNKELTKCYGVLLMKELVDIDFNEKTYNVRDLPLHSVEPVGSRMALDTLFRRFISSHTHLIPIERDDKIIGIASVEDLIEEIIGHEITDETDYAKNRT